MTDFTDPYCIPGTEVLKNKLGLTEATELADVERDLVEIRDTALKRWPLEGLYDLTHLCAFHENLFQDVYDWAGKIRTVHMQKGIAQFCRPQFIRSSAIAIFEALANEPMLPKESNSAADRLAFHLGEINVLHPFREGNGRTQRAFIWQYAHEHGWYIDWTLANAQENIEASWAAMSNSHERLARLIEPLLRPVIDEPEAKPGSTARVGL